MKSVCPPVYSEGTTERVYLFTYFIVHDGTLSKDLRAFKIAAACLKELIAFFINLTSKTVDAVNTVIPWREKL